MSLMLILTGNGQLRPERDIYYEYVFIMLISTAIIMTHHLL